MQTNMLRGKIEAAGHTQNSLAAAMTDRGTKISKNTLSKKVNGIVPFNTDEVICICEILNIHDNYEKASIFLR